MSVNPGKPSKWRVRVAGLPRQGRAVKLEANETERAGIADDFGLLRLPRFGAALTLKPAGREGVRLSGTLEADVVQACVVSLDPVESRMAEEIDRVFVAGAGEEEAAADVEAAEIVVELDAEDPPDPFDGVCLDVEAVLLEHFALALDPYPRKPGVEAPDAGSGQATQEPGPFAALEQLKGAERKGNP